MNEQARAGVHGTQLPCVMRARLQQARFRAESLCFAVLHIGFLLRRRRSLDLIDGYRRRAGLIERSLLHRDRNGTFRRHAPQLPNRSRRVVDERGRPAICNRCIIESG